MRFAKLTPLTSGYYWALISPGRMIPEVVYLDVKETEICIERIGTDTLLSSDVEAVLWGDSVSIPAEVDIPQEDMPSIVWTSVKAAHDCLQPIHTMSFGLVGGHRFFKLVGKRIDGGFIYRLTCLLPGHSLWGKVFNAEERAKEYAEVFLKQFRNNQCW